MSKKKKIIIAVFVVGALLVAAIYVSEQKNRNKFEEDHIEKLGVRLNKN